ncbi:MAG: hypothetical protein ACFE0Q_15235 [Anaerolineae bacterium]
MIRDGICPECGATEIYTRKGWFNNVIVAFSPPRTDVYVCGRCGYLAEFVAQGSHLNYIRNNWSAYQSGEKRKREQIDSQNDPEA